MPWYDNPAIQSAFAPLLLAAIILFILQRQRAWAEPAAALACFLMTTHLITGISFQPLTSTRKVVLLTILFFIAGFIFSRIKLRKSLLLPVAAVSGIGSACWIIWPWLVRQEWLLAVSVVVACAAFVIASTAGFLKAGASRRKFLAIAGIFTICSSAAAIIGATALIGQMAMSLAMVCFVAFVLDWIKPYSQGNSEFLVLNLCVPAVLLAIVSAIYAEVPWYVLVALSLIPLSSFFLLPASINKRYKLPAEITIAAIPGLLAILLTWNSAGPVPM